MVGGGGAKEKVSRQAGQGGGGEGARPTLLLPLPFAAQTPADSRHASHQQRWAAAGTHQAPDIYVCVVIAALHHLGGQVV